MKNSIHFLLLTLSFNFLSSQIFNNATVIKVQPNTVMYSTGSLQVVSAGTMVNDGNVQVATGAFNSDTTNGSKIRNTYTNANSYGQLILGAGVVVATDDQTIQEHLIPPAASFVFSQISFPFQGLTVQQFANENGIPNQTGFQAALGGRESSIYSFNNSNISYFPALYTEAIVPGVRYALNNKNAGFGSTYFTPLANNVINTVTNGMPQAQNVVLSNLNDYSTFAASSNWFNGQNQYGSIYTTYLQDNVRLVSNPNHLRFGYNFGNPYNSNLDFSHIGIAGGSNDTDGVVLPVLAVGKIGTGYTISGIQGNISSPLIALFNTAGGVTNGQLLAGDIGALIIKPYEPFGIYFTSAPGTFTFTQGMKTFSITPKAATDKDGIPGNGDSYSPGPIVPSSVRKIKSNQVAPTFSSLSFGLKVSAKGSNESSNTTYIMANKDVSINGDFATGFDSKEVVGSIVYTIDPTSDNSKTLHKINGIKSTESKITPLGLNIQSNQNKEYTISVDSNSLIRAGGFNADYGKFFKFYDKQEDVRLDITPDFTYTFTQNGSTEDRFFIEYGKVLETNSVNPVPVNAIVSSKIASENSVNYLIIGNDINVAKPSAQVYSVNGQLIDNFSTNGDKKILLNKYPVGIYYIKIEGLEKSIKLVSSN